MATITKRTVKGFDWSYPTSTNAQRFGFDAVGCWTVWTMTTRTDDSSAKSRTLSGHGTQGEALRAACAVDRPWAGFGANALRVVVTSEGGAEQCRCTLGEFVKANEAAWPKRLRNLMAGGIAERINALGVDRLDCGAGGVFEIRAE